MEKSWIVFPENRQYVLTKKADKATWFWVFFHVILCLKLKEQKTLLSEVANFIQK